MFISTEMKSNLLLVGFGESHVAVLCDWYRESREAFEASGDFGNQELALWSVLEDIREDQEALSIFIVENMVAPGAQAKILAWAFRGILPKLETEKTDAELIAQAHSFMSGFLTDPIPE